MMIIDIRKLNAQKKYSGSMEFSYTPEETFIDIPYVKIVGEVKISFNYELYEDDALEIRGAVRFRLEGQCSRCLQPAAMDVEGELDALFEPTKDYADYGYANGKVDITQAVEDAMMACMPYTVLCKENCEGISYQS